MKQSWDWISAVDLTLRNHYSQKFIHLSTLTQVKRTNKEICLQSLPWKVHTKCY